MSELKTWHAEWPERPEKVALIFETASYEQIAKVCAEDDIVMLISEIPEMLQEIEQLRIERDALKSRINDIEILHQSSCGRADRWQKLHDSIQKRIDGDGSRQGQDQD